MLKYITGHLPAFGLAAFALGYALTGDWTNFGTSLLTALAGFGLVHAQATLHARRPGR